MKTNSQICKLILPNSISQHYLKFPLLFMLFSLFVLSGCKDESIESSANDFLKGNEAESGVLNVPCPSTNFTIPLNCRTNNSNNCTRRDLDPCIYVNMYAYAADVACELNKFINGCPYFELQVSPPCEVYTFCLRLSVSSAMNSLIPDFSPWEYCSSSNCDPFYCWGDAFPYRHMAIPSNYQDAMLQHARTIALAYIVHFTDFTQEIPCSEEDVFIKEIQFYVEIHPTLNCSSSVPDRCHNTEIRMKVDYYCCD